MFKVTFDQSNAFLLNKSIMIQKQNVLIDNVLLDCPGIPSAST